MKQNNFPYGIHARIIVFIAILVVNFLMFYPGKNIGFYSDDIHLIRNYSSTEIGSIFIGNWDPDHIENPGYRPLTTLFNQLRYSLFGESVAGHRWFLIGLSTISFFGFVYLLQLIGAHWVAGLCASLVSIITPVNAIHIAWLSNGVHILQFLALIIAAILWVWGERVRSKLFMLSGIILAFLSLLVREDSISGLLVVATLPAIDRLVHGETDYRVLLRSQAKYAILVILIVGSYMVLRMFALADVANRYTIQPIQFIVGLLKLAPLFFAHSILAKIVGVGICAFTLTLLRKRDFLILAYLLLITIVASSHCIIVSRSELVLFPSIIIATALALAGRIVFLRRKSFFPLFCFLTVLVGLSAARESLLYQQVFNPMSLMTIRYDIGLLSGEYQRYGTPTIPKIRRDSIEAKLHSIGLGDSLTNYDLFNSFAARADKGENIAPIIFNKYMQHIRLPKKH